ncbi:MAG: Hsp33 family molecular chaperone HslO [Cellvibrionaceae bacterium]|nr:Hsp33 family molecular chaperone HslO [Cellvibrionaceae bacterium]
MTRSTKPTDQIHRFLFEQNDLRGEIVTLESSFQQAVAHQNLSSGLKQLLGDFLAAVSLLSESMKFEGILTLQARGDGDIPLIMAEATHQGEIRGIIKTKPSCKYAADKPSLQQSLGNAVLSLTIDPSRGERYQGIVPLNEEQLADCISHYFQQSEQLPSQLWLHSSEEACGGIMLQSLPMQKETDLAQARDTWHTLAQLTQTLSAEELFTLDHETLLYRLYHEYACRVYPAKPLHHACRCSRQRSENAIVSLGKEDALDLVRQQGKVSIDCQFCGQHYHFDSTQVKHLFEEHSKLH